MDPQWWFTKLFEVALSPYGGVFFLGLLTGVSLAWWAISKYVVDQKIAAQEALCEAKIVALHQDIERLKPIAEKWNNFMERKALEALGD